MADHGLQLFSLVVQLQATHPLLQGFRLGNGLIQGVTGCFKALFTGGQLVLEGFELLLSRGHRALELLQAASCIRPALQHRLPLQELILSAQLLLMKVLALLEQWQLGIKCLKGRRGLREVPLRLVLGLLFELQLVELLDRCGFSFGGTIQFRASTAFPASIGVAQRPALTNRVLQLLIKPRLDRLGLPLQLLQQPLLIDAVRGKTQRIDPCLTLPNPQMGPTLTQT